MLAIALQIHRLFINSIPLYSSDLPETTNGVPRKQACFTSAKLAGLRANERKCFLVSIDQNPFTNEKQKDFLLQQQVSHEERVALEYERQRAPMSESLALVLKPCERLLSEVKFEVFGLQRRRAQKQQRKEMRRLLADRAEELRERLERVQAQSQHLEERRRLESVLTDLHRLGPPSPEQYDVCQRPRVEEAYTLLNHQFTVDPDIARTSLEASLAWIPQHPLLQVPEVQMFFSNMDPPLKAQLQAIPMESVPEFL